MSPASVYRIFLHIINEVVHPSHVPFIIKSKAVIFYISGNLRPGCRLLCDQKHIWVFLLENRIQMLQKFDSFQILIPAVNVGYPFSVILSIIQIEHRCHSIHTDSVRVILLCPEQSIGNQEVFHLRTSVIID